MTVRLAARFSSEGEGECGRGQGARESVDVEARPTRSPDTLGRLGEAFTAALTTARARGELPGDADVAALGRFLVTALVGLQALARAHPDPNLLRDSVAVALKTLR